MGEDTEGRNGGEVTPQDQQQDEPLKQPFAPMNARPRRWDGNEVWWALRSWLKSNVGDRLLDIGPIEFAWTLYHGPVYYEPTDIPATPEKVEEMVATKDVERLKELYEHSKGLMKREEDTRTSIEGRANVLLGTGGLTTTLIVGVSGLLVRSDTDTLLPLNSASRNLFLGLYLAGLLALIMSLLRAVHTVRVGAIQPFSATRPFEVQQWSEASRLRRLIREAFLTFVDARESNRVKAGLLAAAQWWFGAALILLLAMASVPLLGDFFEALWGVIVGLVLLLGDFVGSLWGVIVGLARALGTLVSQLVEACR